MIPFPLFFVSTGLPRGKRHRMTQCIAPHSSRVLWQSILELVLATIAAAGAIAASHLQRRRETSAMHHAICSGFSGGVFYGCAFMHLLNDSQEDLSEFSQYPFSNLCLLVGAGLMAVNDLVQRKPAVSMLSGASDYDTPASASFLATPPRENYSPAMLLGGDAAL